MILTNRQETLVGVGMSSIYTARQNGYLACLGKGGLTALIVTAQRIRILGKEILYFSILRNIID